MAHFKLERTIHAPLEKVWAAADFTKSCDPLPMEVAKEGDPALLGVGFERAVSANGIKVVERLVSIDPPHFFSYTMVSGVPVKEGYLGKVAFTEKDGATVITWSGVFTPIIPGTGWLITFMSKKTINKIIDAIAEKSLK